MNAAGKPKILIVEDDAMTRLLLRKILSVEPQWEISEADNGVSAWQQLAQGPCFDVCIADLLMPKLDGIGLLRRIRATEALKDLKVILCTTLRDRDTIESVANLSVDYYVVKPFKKELVLERVREALRSREGLQGPPERSIIKTDVEGFLRRTRNLPSLPSVYHELLRAVGESEISISHISEIILRDQALTCRLLRLANSAFYGTRSQIQTVEAATELVGLSQIQELVLATSLIESFDKLPASRVDVSTFWEHSLVCGLASALVAEFQRDPLPERLFVAGLLHDIGRLIMFLNAPEQCREILARCEREGQLACPVEADVFGFDHAELGGEMLAAWGLPASVAEIVRRHHLPPKSSSISEDICRVHYADFIVTAMNLGNGGELYVAPLVLPAEVEAALFNDCPIGAFLDELDRRCRRLIPTILQDASGRGKNSPGEQDLAPCPDSSLSFGRDSAVHTSISDAQLRAAEACVNDRLRHVPSESPVVKAIRERAIFQTARSGHSFE